MKTPQIFVTLDEYRNIKYISKDLVLYSVPKETELTYRPEQEIIQIKPTKLEYLEDCLSCVKRECQVLPYCLQDSNPEHVCPLNKQKAKIIRRELVASHYRHNLHIKTKRDLYIGLNIYGLESKDFQKKIVCDLDIISKILPNGKFYNLLNLFKHSNGRSDPELAEYNFSIKTKSRGYELKLNGNNVYLVFNKIKKVKTNNN